METNKLLVIYAGRMFFRLVSFYDTSQTCFTFFFFFFCFYQKITRLFLCNIGYLTLISQFVWLFLCIYLYYIFVNFPTLNKLLKSFSVSFTLLLKVLYLLVSYPLSYTSLKSEPQISICIYV